MSEETNNSLVEGTSKASDVISAVNSLLEGGGGGGTPPSPSDATGIELVTTDAEEAAATDENKVYFFSNGPRRGKGLYNTLLQEGSCVGKDGVTYTYSPRKLYHLYPDGSFDEVMPQEGDVTYQGNAVYYKGRRTPMMRYGELVVTKKIVQNATSDSAYFSFQVAGPFYEDETPVMLRYNDNYVKVYEVTKSGNVWTETLRADGYQFSADESDYCTARTLRFERQSSPDTQLNVAIRFITGDPEGFHIDTDIHVKFYPTEVFFKAAAGSTLAQVNSSRPSGVAEWPASYCSLNAAGRLLLANSGTSRTHSIKEYHTDQTVKHVFYAKVYGNNNEDGMHLEVKWSEWKNYTTIQMFKNISNLYWYSERSTDRVYGDWMLARCTMQELNHSFRYIGKTDMDGELFEDGATNADEIDVVLNIRQRNSSYNYQYDEIGVIDFDGDAADTTGEIPATT